MGDELHPIQTLDGLKRLWKIGVETGRILQAAETCAATPKPPAGGDAIPAEMTREERRLEDLKQMAAYAGPVVSFDVRDPYYLASCDGCGWVGSSEACGTDEADDVFCPRCFRSGADCGRVAGRVAATPKPPAGVVSASGENK